MFGAATLPAPSSPPEDGDHQRAAVLVSGNVCELLAARGLPGWLLECVQTAVQRSVRRSAVPLGPGAEGVAGGRQMAITSEDLAATGIAHPLHRRRVLKELELIFSAPKEGWLPEAQRQEAARGVQPEMCVFVPEVTVQLKQPQQNQPQQHQQHHGQEQHAEQQQDNVEQQEDQQHDQGQLEPGIQSPGRPAFFPRGGRRTARLKQILPIAGRRRPRSSPPAPHFRWPFPPASLGTPSVSEAGNPVVPEEPVHGHRGRGVRFGTWGSEKEYHSLKHARRRQLKAFTDSGGEASPQLFSEMLQHRASWQSPRKGKQMDFLPLSIADDTETLAEQVRKSALLQVNEVADVNVNVEEQEAILRRNGLDWESWLQGRLHPSGTLAVVDEVLRLALRGNITELRQGIARIEAHGAELTSSLMSEPVPEKLSKVFPHAPADNPPPRTAWAWLTWRLATLETAENRLAGLLADARELIRSCVDDRKFLATKSTAARNTILASLLPGLQKRSQQYVRGSLARATPIREEEEDSGSSSPRSPVKQEEDSASEEELQEKDALEAASIPQPPRRPLSQTSFSISYAMQMAAGLLKFRKAVKLVQRNLALEKAQKQERRHSTTKGKTKPVFFLALQDRIETVRDQVEKLIREIDYWPGLQSRSRSSAFAVVEQLASNSEQLFERFLDLRQPVEKALRELTLGSQGVVDGDDLEDCLISTQREVAIRMLIGDKAVEAARAAGISPWPSVEDEPVNPWRDFDRPGPPPWEATFMRALQRVETLKNMRRKRGHSMWGGGVNDDDSD
ncbi:unnamed protein product [Polarella glacialis]|uniref:SAM domain-containing protein n=1 Tax=Polarella glacialis TaxID=89957 RepID=A0A813L302_POLGL|nr:unnamed protein product [Polarella glacialis]CAE8721426.1 unnamed protein product [Polarella glacialis]